MPALVTFKLEKQFLQQVDKTVKEENYANRTDLIRDALREKLEAIEKERRLKQIEQWFGSKKTHTSDEELKRIREEVAQEYMKKYGLE